MIVFAWILWSIYIFTFFIQFAIIIGCCFALNDPTKEVRFRINLADQLINIAVFVFLTLYLFL